MCYTSAAGISINRAEIQRVLTALQEQGTCVSWKKWLLDVMDDQIILAIDHLSQNSEVFLMLDADGTYGV